MSVRVYYPVARTILSVILDGFGDDTKDSDPFFIQVIPKAVTVHRNAYHKADTWEVTFDAGDLPLDPQQVKFGAADIYLYQLPSLDDDKRVTSRQMAASDNPSGIKGQDELAGLRRELSVSEIHRFTNDNEPMVTGLFDDQSIDMTADGKWVTISGQDYTAYLAAKQWPPTAKHTARKIPVGKRLDHQLRAILEEVDTDSRLTLTVEPKELEHDLPIVGSKETNGSKRGIPVEESTSYWDVMYKLAIRHGYILFVRGNDVFLTTPKNADARTVQTKKLAWGQNLESLRMTRHLGKERVPRIIMKGYDTIARKMVTVEFPDSKLTKAVKSKIGLAGFKPSSKTSITEKHTTAGTKSGKPKKAAPLKVEDEYEIIPATDFGITDEAMMRQAAEALYHLRGHSERKLVAVTRDLNDMRESSLMDLASGDAVEVEWDDFNRELIANPDVPEAAKFQHLVARGFNEAIASAIAQNYTILLGQKRPMRVHEVSYDYSVDDGIRIEMELNDFVVVDGSRDGSTRRRGN